MSEPTQIPPTEPPDGNTAGGEELPAHLLARLRIVIPGYRLLSQISQGGQAFVFKAVQEKTGKTVALKLLREGPYADQTARERLQREVRVLAALNHPGIVGVIDSGQTSDGHDFLVMNYIDGRSLDRFVHEQAASEESGGPGDPAMLLKLFMKICDAVNTAHLRGITHRDLSPSNILIDERNEPHVLDFGLARTAFERFINVERRDISVTGQFLGKLAYASPEQAKGDPGKIDIRTDVYALGVILYQLLTGGQFPYEVVGNIADVLNNIIHAKPTPPSKLLEARDAREAKRAEKLRTRHPAIVNPAIEAIVLKALEKDPTARYQSAGELAKDIGNYLSGQPTVARVGADRSGRAQIPQRWRIAIASAAVLVLAGVIVGAIATIRNGAAPHLAEPIDEMATTPPDELEVPPTTLQAAVGDQRVFLSGPGRWELEGDDLVQTGLARRWPSALVFGRADWTSYDVNLQAQINVEGASFHVFFHWDDANNFCQYVLGGYQNEWHELSARIDGQWKRSAGMVTRGRLRLGRWHSVRLEVRGRDARCYLDGREWFRQSQLPFEKGRVGLQGAINTHFRDIRITTPDGKPLWSGPPDLPDQGPAIQRAYTAPAHLAEAIVPAGGRTIDVLKYVSLPDDQVTGSWSWRGSELLTEASGKIRLRYKPDRPYDYTLVFTRAESGNVGAILSYREKSFAWNGGFGSTGSMGGFGFIDGAGPMRNPTATTQASMFNGRRHTIVVRVRADRVAAYLDGKLMSVFLTDYSNLTAGRPAELGPGNWLGIFVGGRTTIHSATVQFAEP